MKINNTLGWMNLIKKKLKFKMLIDVSQWRLIWKTSQIRFPGPQSKKFTGMVKLSRLLNNELSISKLGSNNYMHRFNWCVNIIIGIFFFWFSFSDFVIPTSMPRFIEFRSPEHLDVLADKHAFGLCRRNM